MLNYMQFVREAIVVRSHTEAREKQPDCIYQRCICLSTVQAEVTKPCLNPLEEHFYENAYGNAAVS